MNTWTPKAELYDFGRPFPHEKVVTLFSWLSNREELKVFEAGCGTGRIIVPLAKAFPGWKFTGLDSYKDSLDVLSKIVQAEQLGNVILSHQSIHDDFGDKPFDLIIHSSVLHAIADWKDVLHKLSGRLSKNGLFCLIGDYGDIYDEALGRCGNSGTDPNLARFWRRYLELRHKFGAPDVESSQIGCRWDLESTDIAVWLTERGFTETKRQKISWIEKFTIHDLMKIVEERCYSSMFTIEPKIYSLIVSELKASLPELVINGCTQSKHTAVARFFQSNSKA